MHRVRLSGALFALIAVSSCAVSNNEPAQVLPTNSSPATPSATPRFATSSPSAPPASTPQRTVAPSPAADTWVEAGEFSDYRVVTYLALLGSGDVLAVGADDVCGVASNGSDTAEVGSPLTGTWSPAARLPSRRNGPVLLALADGRALVTAGFTGENEGAIAKSSTVVFDHETRTWSPSGLLNTARVGPASAALLDGRALVAGGLYLDRSNEGRVKDTAEVWDPATGEWPQTGRLSQARSDAASARLADGRVLVVGGLPTWGADVDELATAEIYDPATGR